MTLPILLVFEPALIYKCIWYENRDVVCIEWWFNSHILHFVQHLCLRLFLLLCLLVFLSGKTFWRQPKLWLRTQRCWCREQPLDRTSCLKRPSLLPKPLPSSQMWSNWGLPASVLMTPRRRSASLVFPPLISSVINTPRLISEVLKNELSQAELW